VLKADEDGHWFVDYLSGGLRLTEFADIARRVAEHRAVVVNGLTNYEEDEVRAKYAWLSKYHRRALHKLMESGVLANNKVKVSQIDVSQPMAVSRERNVTKS
jgi:hypothetical protein